jgi:predicted nucleic acid-binding protein
VKIVVDTSVWSLVLRRQAVDERHAHVQAFRACVEAGHELSLLGPVLQELLDGLCSTQQFSRLLSVLQPFPLVPIQRETYVLAARLRNECRKEGVQASPTDFLIASACIDSGFPLLTADQDFKRIAGCTQLVLVKCPS